MLIRFRFLILAVVLPLLAGCVSVSNKVHLVSNASASTSDATSAIVSDDLQACAVKTLMSSDVNNNPGLNPESIDFLNWNIYKGNGENWQQDLSAFAESHDLMTIQEAEAQDPRPRSESNLNMIFSMGK